MTDKIIVGDHTNGVYTKFERGQILNFIVSEPSSPIRRTRKAVEIDASQFIGAFCDSDGKAVSLKAAADAATIAGIMLTEPATIPGLTANHYDLKATLLIGGAGGETLIKESVLALNGFKGLSHNGVKFICTGLTGATVPADAQKVLDAVISQFITKDIEFVVCGK